jgi:hypothetical protein
MTTPLDVAFMEADGPTALVELRVGGDTHRVSFEASVPLFLERADALVPLALIAGMRRRQPIRVHGPVSARLLANVTRAQQILASFTDGELHPVPVIADAVSVTTPRSPGTASFFSGGIDSFASVLRHRSSITHLVYVQGFDVIVDGTERATASRRGVQAAAAELGLPLIEVATNLRDVTDPHVMWGMAHGAALGVVALLLQSQVGRVLVPSSYPYADLFPWGSHPLLDPLWGNECLDVDHDGCEMTRMQKVALVAESDVALHHLRVCTRQFATYNCGSCRKCLGTMMALRLHGALERCETLPHTFRTRDLARVQVTGPTGLVGWREGRALARRVKDRPMALACAWALRPHPILAVRRPLGRLRRRVTARDPM